MPICPSPTCGCATSRSAGCGTPVEVESYLRGTAVPSDRDHDVLAQALNERFSDLDRNHPVPYAGAD